MLLQTVCQAMMDCVKSKEDAEYLIKNLENIQEEEKKDPDQEERKKWMQIQMKQFQECLHLGPKPIKLL